MGAAHPLHLNRTLRLSSILRSRLSAARVAPAYIDRRPETKRSVPSKRQCRTLCCSSSNGTSAGDQQQFFLTTPLYYVSALALGLAH